MCVIGAGIAGITTAYLLARGGRRVVVLNDGPVGGGETTRTTAHLTNALDDRYHVHERSARGGFRLVLARVPTWRRSRLALSFAPCHS